MKRTQLQLEEATYELLRKRAFEQGVSMANLIRLAIDEYLKGRLSKHIKLEELTFIGAGHSEPSEFDPISERHDEALAEDFAR